jgi:hypothetical protein
VGLRSALAGYTELARKIEELEKRHDSQFQILFDELRALTMPDELERARIGFG